MTKAVKKKEFNLSETRYDGLWYHEKHVKEAVRILKEDLGISSVITRSECFRVINQIMGDKLI